MYCWLPVEFCLVHTRGTLKVIYLIIYNDIGLLLLAMYHRPNEVHNCSRVPACPVFCSMLHDACCLPNLSAIMDGFVETRATIGNEISDKMGQWPKNNT